jgi:putative ABC transport system ATP-binding protein
VDLRIQSGELVTLEGPSGAGKTVLGTCALRLRPPPESGQILWGDHDVTQRSSRALRPLRRTYQGMLQHTGALLPPFMRLRSAMLESLRAVRCSAWTLEEIDEVAALLGIESLLERYPRHLSGGEQRRASLARLILVRPAFAFIDEPDAGLDGPSQVEVMRSICTLVSETGAGVLLVTHQADLAAAFSDRRLRLEGGRVHEL